MYSKYLPAMEEHKTLMWLVVSCGQTLLCGALSIGDTHVLIWCLSLIDKWPTQKNSVFMAKFTDIMNSKESGQQQCRKVSTTSTSRDKYTKMFSVVNNTH